MNLFYEDSTRTRISFEAAAKRLSRRRDQLLGQGLQRLQGREPQGHRADAAGDGRRRGGHPAPGLAARRTGWPTGSTASVLNAGDGTHEHPTQALLDAYTMRSRLGRLAGLHGRDRRRRAAQPGGPLQRAAAAHPRRQGDPGRRRRRCCRSASPRARARHRRLATTSTRCCPSADVVMMLRVQRERMNDSYFPSAREYARRYGLDGAAACAGCPSTRSSCTPAR